MIAIRQLFDRVEPTDPRVRELFVELHERTLRWTDRLFVYLLGFQWLAAVAAALWISPRAWAGDSSAIHVHVYAAVLLGFAIVSLPMLLGIFRPGETMTRQAIAVAQGLMSALLIHLTGGRIETHFHVFCSLALLAFYRDWRVLVTTSAVVALDHFVRGLLWPQSVYGTSLVNPWRFAEHAGWVLVEDAFLFLLCQQGLREMWTVAERQARLESTNLAVSDANQQLRNEIEERLRTERELERAKDAAESSNRAKSEFLANMSHELRTPLNAIIGFSDVLAEQVCGPLNDLQIQYVGDVLESGQHLLSLVNDILDLAKIESGTMDIEYKTVDVPQMAERTIQMFRERAVRNGIRLASDIAADAGEVEADERRLKQLLFNFLSNAMKFTPDGGTITVRARRSDDSIVLSVADSGIGIAEADHDRVFETFYQVDSSLSKNKQGTGLGLALVRRIADLHGGRVWVESQLEVGSEFFVSLPCKVGAEESSRPELACQV
jgi:two-component system sensor histidine kinase/response regulator